MPQRSQEMSACGMSRCGKSEQLLAIVNIFPGAEPQRLEDIQRDGVTAKSGGIFDRASSKQSLTCNYKDGGASAIESCVLALFIIPPPPQVMDEEVYSALEAAEEARALLPALLSAFDNHQVSLLAVGRLRMVLMKQAHSTKHIFTNVFISNHSSDELFQRAA